MNATLQTNEGRCDGKTETLADVLFADKSKSRVSEKDWVGVVQSIAAGDQRALRALYERTHRIVFTLIIRITDNRETAEELTLDVFHQVWRRASTYDPADGSVVGWILNQARSRAIDRVRFERRKKRVNGHPDDPSQATAVSASDEVFVLAQEGRLVREALTVLTPHERQVIETTFFSELTYSEAAEQLNQPLGTVKTRIRSGLEKLRRALTSKVRQL